MGSSFKKGRVIMGSFKGSFGHCENHKGLKWL
jgi:hypothetical protein